MTQVLDSINKAGSRRTSDPCLLGDFLQEYLSSSNEPFAVAFREHTEMDKVKQKNADNHGKE